jgi:hypothetical protein
MQVVSHVRRSSNQGPPRARCVFCREALPLGDPTRSSGVCKLCASEIEEFGWRTIYDRDRNVGQIPANLRVAYKL